MVARGRPDRSTWEALIADGLDEAARRWQVAPERLPTLRLHQRDSPLGHRVLVSEYDPMAHEVVFHLADLAACVDYGWAEATVLTRYLAHHELGHAAELEALQRSGLNPYLHQVNARSERGWQISYWADLRQAVHALINGTMDYAINQRLAQWGLVAPLSLEMVLGDLTRRATQKPDSIAYQVRRDLLAHFNRVLFCDRADRANAQRLQQLCQRIVGTPEWGWVAAAVQRVHFGEAAGYEEALPRVAAALFPDLQVEVRAVPLELLPAGTRLPKGWHTSPMRYFHWDLEKKRPISTGPAGLPAAG